jgi:hypothetical protein
MKFFTTLLKVSVTLCAAVSALLLTSCAVFNEMEAPPTEQLLVAAGFQVRPVTTPQQKAIASYVTPFKVHMRTKGNRAYYIYSDPKRGIVYVGGPKQYQKYQQLNVQQGIAEDQMAAAAEMQMMDLDEESLWSPFWD